MRSMAKQRPHWNRHDIPEANQYIYLGIMLNQSIRPKTHQQYIKDKVKYLKRRICLLILSLANMNSRLALYKTIVLPQLTNACKTIYNNLQWNKTLRSALYRWLKSILCIKANVNTEKLLNVLHLNMEAFKESWILRRNILGHFTVKVIKLRAHWLFSRRKEKLCSCTHKIESKEIVLYPKR